VQVIYVKLSVVMGLSWLVGFVAAATDWTALWYLFIVVNSLLGALLCAAFVVTRQVKRLLADCVRPLRRRAPFGTAAAGISASESMKSPEVQTPGISTEVMRLSLPEVNKVSSAT